MACDAGHLACVSLLLHFGANRQLRDGTGNQAVHAAAQSGDANILRLLLDPRRSASVGEDDQLNRGVNDGNLLHSDEFVAGEAPHTPRVDVNETADVNSRNALRQTPLHLAVNRHDFIVAQCLLDDWNALSNLQVTVCLLNSSGLVNCGIGMLGCM